VRNVIALGVGVTIGSFFLIYWSIFHMSGDSGAAVLIIGMCSPAASFGGLVWFAERRANRRSTQ